MRKFYMDMTENMDCVSLYIKDAEIIQAGATIYSMPVSDRNAEYQKLADMYDIHFIFDDMNVRVDFYTVPRVDILAVDSCSGYIATVGEMSDLDSNAPICYIDQNKNAYFIASNMKTFMADIANWRINLKQYDGIQFFQTKEEAQTMYEFLDVKTSAAEESANVKTGNGSI